jgi:hypothetical protein
MPSSEKSEHPEMSRPCIRRERAERERLQVDARARQAKHEQQAKRLGMLAAAVVVGVLLLVLAVWLMAKYRVGGDELRGTPAGNA